MANEPKGEPVVMAYAGRRMMANSKIAHVLYPLVADKLGEKQFYSSVKLRLTVGGLYEGARYDAKEKTLYGINTLHWFAPYDDEEQVAGWRGLDHLVGKELASAKAEAKYKEGLHAALLPQRRVISSLFRRGQTNEAQAYRDMVVAELFRPLTKTEREAEE